MALSTPHRPRHACNHALPPPFRPGQPVVIEATLGHSQHETGPIAIHLHYRRVNQAEPHRIVEMPAEGSHYQAIIPGEYTDSRYPLQYYFELRDEHGQAWLHPGFSADLCSQPYFVLRQGRQSVTIATGPAVPVRTLQP